MARSAKPWFRKDRKAWFVTINGVRHNLGPDRSEAFRQFHALMQTPESITVRSQSFVAVADAFLEWLHTHRSEGTVGFYQYLVERFCRKYPDLLVSELRPFHVQQWVDTLSLDASKPATHGRFKTSRGVDVQ